MKRQLTLAGLALLAAGSISAAASDNPQKPCDPKDQDCLAAIVQQFVQEAPNEQAVLQQEAIESGHLYLLEVAGKEVQVVLRDPQDRRAPFFVRLPGEWKPILDGSEPAEAGRIVAAVRQGFDELVTEIRRLNEAGAPVGKDTLHFQALGGRITEQYLDELLGRLAGSGATPEVKAAGERLKKAADARLAEEASFYADKGGDEAEAEDVKLLYGYLESIHLVQFG